MPQTESPVSLFRNMGRDQVFCRFRQYSVMTGFDTLQTFLSLHQEAQDKYRALAAALLLGQGFLYCSFCSSFGSYLYSPLNSFICGPSMASHLKSFLEVIDNT